MLKIEQKKGYKQFTIKNAYLNETGILDEQNVRTMLLKYRMKKYYGIDYDKITKIITCEIIHLDRCISIIKRYRYLNENKMLLNDLERYEKKKQRYIRFLENMHAYY